MFDWTTWEPDFDDEEVGWEEEEDPLNLDPEDWDVPYEEGDLDSA